MYSNEDSFILQYCDTVIPIQYDIYIYNILSMCHSTYSTNSTYSTVLLYCMSSSTVVMYCTGKLTSSTLL